MEASLRSLKLQKPLSGCSNTAVTSSPGSPAPSTPKLSGTRNYEIPEPCSVYSRKQSAAKRKSTGKENDVRFSCPRNVGKKAKQDGPRYMSDQLRTLIVATPNTIVSCRVLPAKKETSGYTSPELEKQKAYFAELDEYELEEAEESELDE